LGILDNIVGENAKALKGIQICNSYRGKMRKRKIVSMLLVVVLIVSMLINAFLFGPLIITSRAGPGDISESWYNETPLNVTVFQLQPRICLF